MVFSYLSIQQRMLERPEVHSDASPIDDGVEIPTERG